MNLENQVALVTGASRGIGNAIALKLGLAGAYMIGTATGEQGIQTINKHFVDKGIKGRALTLDVSSVESVNHLAEIFLTENIKPTILVNNAGITRDNLLMKMSDEEWEEVINTNLSSIFRLTRLCIRNMIKARAGRIINITSVVGATGNPGQTNYSAAKAGIVGFTKALAREVGARGITVNAIAPGFIRTDMTDRLDDSQRQILLEQIPMKRLGEPEEVAKVVLFLASEAANYITGETIHVNGGLYMG